MGDENSNALLTVQLKQLNDQVGTVELVGEIDMSTSHLLDEEFKAVAATDLTSVIIDTTGVTFIDSTGLHALIECKRVIHEKGIRMFLVPSKQVRRLLELVFPGPLFAERVDTVDAALSELHIEN